MKKFLFSLTLMILFGLNSASTQADSPYLTWTLGASGGFFPSQDAYTPLAEIDLPVSGPEDMFLAPDGSLYIADTGNARVIRLDENFEIEAEFGADILRSPTGIFVDAEGILYIADAGSNTVIILDANGELINQLSRPTEPLFGANREFRPRKLTVDARGNIYIVSEGSVDGLVMMNTNGNFIGYFGANPADMSLKMILQRIFLNPEQLAQFIRNEAPSPSNITIDPQSLIYTVTSGTDSSQSIRKYTVSGSNIMNDIFGSNTFRDITVSDSGLIAAVNVNGTIYEYDTNGMPLFIFGGLDRGDQRLGLLRNPVAIERVGNDLYVLDKDKNAIVTYGATEFAQRLHEGVNLYIEGFYANARPYFEDVLNDNGMMMIAYQAIADADFSAGNYSDALAFYRYAGDQFGYSQAYWELRNSVLQRSLGSALGVLFVGWVVLSISKRVERRYKFLDPVRRALKSLQKIRLIDDFVFMFRFIKQPVDSFYYIKENARGSLLFALLIYVWIVVIRVLALYLTGFIFNTSVWSWQIHPEREILYTLSVFALWNTANYLVATISDGEGSFRQTVIGSAYSLFPYALFALPITLLSNVLTMNETFVYTFSTQVILMWCGVMLFIMVKEIHNYTFSETVRNIIITIFTMAMFLLTLYVLNVLFTQLYEFILTIIQEVGLRG